MTIAGIDADTLDLAAAKAILLDALRSLDPDSEVEIDKFEFGDNGGLDIKYTVTRTNPGPGVTQDLIRELFDFDHADFIEGLKTEEVFAPYFPGINITNHSIVLVPPVERLSPAAKHQQPLEVVKFGQLTLEGVDDSDINNPKLHRVMTRALNDMKLSEAGGDVDRLELISVKPLGNGSSEVNYKIHMQTKPGERIEMEDSAPAVDASFNAPDFLSALKRHATNDGMQALSRRRNLKLKKAVRAAKPLTDVGDDIEDVALLKAIPERRKRKAYISGAFEIVGEKLEGADSLDASGVIENAICDIPYELGLDPSACKIHVNHENLEDGKRYRIKYSNCLAVMRQQRWKFAKNSSLRLGEKVTLRMPSSEKPRLQTVVP